ncbi:MAG: MbtH family NRPS accessory protein [Nitrococcus sp.]|nr:MbtH family NRPS accessory protein [Nitrococcus sp.]
MTFDREDITFEVVINPEEQYSIWPQYKALPLGWQKVGVAGSKQDCLEHIDRVWTDMRPKSLRDKMDSTLQ